MAKFIAIVARNALEDFHVKHLSDVQMRELNPIIRNAVFTALHAACLTHPSERMSAWIDWQQRCIPTYWEEPELLPGYAKVLDRDSRGIPFPSDPSLEEKGTSDAGSKRLPRAA